MSRAVIFDLDGTLIDSAPDIHAAVNAMLAEGGHAVLSLAEVRGFIGNGVPKLVERVMRAIGASPDTHADMLARFHHHYMRAPAALTTLYPGVAEALAKLRRAGCTLGLCTNKPEEPTRMILAAFNLTEHFSAVVGGDTLPVRKPDPAPLRHCMALMGVQSCLFVGDSEVDAETARRAGTRFALFTEGYRRGPVERIPHDAAFAMFSALPGIAAAHI